MIETSLLPQWLAELLPPVQPPDILTLDGDEIVLVCANGVVNLGTDIEEAYDQARVLTDNMEFGPELVAKFGDGELSADGFFCIPSDFGIRLIAATTDTERLRRIEQAYKTWLEIYEKWQRDKTKFMPAYLMISYHPAFWTRANRIKVDDARWTPGELWEWNTGGYAGEMWILPVRDMDEHYFMAEAGGHVADLERCHDGKLVQILGDYTVTCHDLRLDVYAKTYEGACIEMALKVDKFFAPDGTERENVSYEKSELEKELDERSAKVEEFFASRPRPEKAKVKYADYHQWLIENGELS